MEDDKIIDLYWKRDENAVTETASKYGRVIYRLGKRLLCMHEEAEECENDTYLQTWKTIPPEKPASLKYYVLKLCRNIACNRLTWLKAKKRNSVVVELSEELSECIPSSCRTEDGVMLGIILNDFLKMQPEVNRTLFIRRYWYGDSVHSMAESYHFSESKVKMILLRTRAKLKKVLQEE